MFPARVNISHHPKWSVNASLWPRAATPIWIFCRSGWTTWRHAWIVSKGASNASKRAARFDRALICPQIPPSEIKQKGTNQQGQHSSFCDRGGSHVAERHMGRAKCARRQGCYGRFSNECFGCQPCEKAQIFDVMASHDGAARRSSFVPHRKTIGHETSKSTIYNLLATLVDCRAIPGGRRATANARRATQRSGEVGSDRATSTLWGRQDPQIIRGSCKPLAIITCKSPPLLILIAVTGMTKKGGWPCLPTV